MQTEGTRWITYWWRPCAKNLVWSLQSWCKVWSTCKALQSYIIVSKELWTVSFNDGTRRLEVFSKAGLWFLQIYCLRIAPSYYSNWRDWIIWDMNTLTKLVRFVGIQVEIWVWSWSLSENRTVRHGKNANYGLKHRWFIISLLWSYTMAIDTSISYHYIIHHPQLMIGWLTGVDNSVWGDAGLGPWPGHRFACVASLDSWRFCHRKWMEHIQDWRCGLRGINIRTSQIPRFV